LRLVEADVEACLWLTDAFRDQGRHMPEDLRVVEIVCSDPDDAVGLEVVAKGVSKGSGIRVVVEQE
jgi:hydroxymethylpyrimidine pyrophosphatase-like HAD family hydrolase